MYLVITFLNVYFRYLATGCSLTELHYTFRVGRSTASYIIKDISEAIWFSLAESTIPPLTAQKFLEIAEGFKKFTNFPNVFGAIYGKHIRTKQLCFKIIKNISRQSFLRCVMPITASLTLTWALTANQVMQEF